MACAQDGLAALRQASGDEQGPTGVPAASAAELIKALEQEVAPLVLVQAIQRQCHLSPSELQASLPSISTFATSLHERAT